MDLTTYTNYFSDYAESQYCPALFNNWKSSLGYTAQSIPITSPFAKLHFHQFHNKGAIPWHKSCIQVWHHICIHALQAGFTCPIEYVDSYLKQDASSNYLLVTSMQVAYNCMQVTCVMETRLNSNAFQVLKFFFFVPDYTDQNAAHAVTLRSLPQSWSCGPGTWCSMYIASHVLSAAHPLTKETHLA